MPRDDDETPGNPRASRDPELFSRLIQARLSRRTFLQGISAASFAYVVGCGTSSKPPSFSFDPICPSIGPDHGVAKGHRADVLISWGDPVLKGSKKVANFAYLDGEEQASQFGYNNDFIAYFPLDGSTRGLLCVNYEYTNPHIMFPGLGGLQSKDCLTRAQIEVEMAAQGHGIIEVERKTLDGDDTKYEWSVVKDSKYARRITAKTKVEIRGPAAGDEKLKTGQDPMGRTCYGTFNNCAGGVTPWGTVLIAEENFHGYFWGDPKIGPQAEDRARYGIGSPSYGWGRPNPSGEELPPQQARFNLQIEPNEPHRFGWIVEIDPKDPSKAPIKRTALGRFKHEGACCALSSDGRVVVYTGDDQSFEYLYRYVSRDRVDFSGAPSANDHLLDEGTLYVAQFHDDGSLRWLPMIHGEGPLTVANGFASQADVVIHSRKAGDLLGATPLDRPEDVEPSPKTGHVYAMLTNNSSRKEEQIDAANPRADNVHGHVLELIPPGTDSDRDHGAATFKWNVFLMAGPRDSQRIPPPSIGEGLENLHCPDNCAFDPDGGLWIATDQGADEAKNEVADGLWAIDTSGEIPHPMMLYKVPIGAELCGPCFTPDGCTLFVAVQHPGDGSSFEEPSTRFPNLEGKDPPRPSVVVITRRDGGRVGYG